VVEGVNIDGKQQSYGKGKYSLVKPALAVHERRVTRDASIKFKTDRGMCMHGLLNPSLAHALLLEQL